MTTSSAAGTGTTSNVLVTQPAFSPQMQYTLSAALGTNVNLQRGYLIWADAGWMNYTGGELGDGRDVIHFMFNPSTVSTSYTTANATLQAAMMFPDPGSTGVLLAPLQQTVSWDLYYDRTFELAFGDNPGAANAVNNPSVIGCQADVLQFMQFTGVLANLGAYSGAVSALTGPAGTTTATGTTTNAGATTAALSQGGMMMMVRAYVFFGNPVMQAAGTATGNFNAVNNQLAFFGYISNWSVQYTHFTANMVPIRCVISVTFTMLPSPGNVQQQPVWSDAGKVSTGLTVPMP